MPLNRQWHRKTGLHPSHLQRAAVQGQWKWDVLDQQMNYLTEHAFMYGGMLIGNPKWNTNDQPGSLRLHARDVISMYAQFEYRFSTGAVNERGPFFR